LLNDQKLSERLFDFSQFVTNCDHVTSSLLQTFNVTRQTSRSQHGNVI